MDKSRMLNGDVLRVYGFAVSPALDKVRNSQGHWYSMAWSYHLQRYESSAAHVDAVLRLAAVSLQ